nr:putative ribonuclease H-like domain-containing protein [Tanacetum cinerariifolium]
MNQNFFEPNPCYEPNSSNFDQYQPLQSFVTQQIPQRSNEDIRLEMAKLIKNNRILLNNNIFPHEEASMEVLLATKRILKLIKAWDNKQIESWSFPELLPQLLNDSRTIDEMLKQREQAANLANRPTFYNDDEEHSIQYKEYLESSSNAIAPVLPTEEPEYSLSMGYEHLSTISKTESDEVIKSHSFDVLKNHSEILSDSNNDDTSSDDDAFEDIEYVEATLFDSELVNLEEENDNNPTPDRVLKSSSSFLIFEKSDNSLSYSENSLPEFKTFSDHTEETRSGSTTTHANNSLPEYDSFCFEIEPDQGRLTNVVMKDIFDNSTNVPLLEEVDLFLASDNLIPPGIENIDYNSEGDIHFLEELLVDDSIPLAENESSNFDHHDDPSFPRPPPEPPDVEFFFDFEPNSKELISAVMNNIDELNEDECFDPGGEIDVFVNIEDDDYFSFILVIRIFLPYLIYPERGLQAQVRVVRTDKGTKFLNQTLHAYFTAEGIQHQTSVARTPEQNGIVERWNRTLVEAARTMLSAAKVLLFFWLKQLYTWTHFLRSKDETPKVLIDFLWLIQRGLQAQVRIVRTNKGTEFLNQNLHAYFAAEGILHQTSVAQTPEQNGVVERRNRTLVEAARTMLSAAKVPLFF